MQDGTGYMMYMDAAGTIEWHTGSEGLVVQRCNGSIWWLELKPYEASQVD